MLVHEERAVCTRAQTRCVQLTIEHVDVVTQALERMRAQWNQPLASTLSTNDDALVGFVEIRPVDRHDFAYSDTS